ncbi:hypothetical protein Pvag_pPag20047 (plasmid) [Pantoea vagans C9-1]|nr:hypothetical protein Pvag_pPag20047 [Pantoea vagans C9-1]
MYLYHLQLFLDALIISADFLYLKNYSLSQQLMMSSQEMAPYKESFSVNEMS